MDRILSMYRPYTGNSKEIIADIYSVEVGLQHTLVAAVLFCFLGFCTNRLVPILFPGYYKALPDKKKEEDLPPSSGAAASSVPGAGGGLPANTAPGAVTTNKIEQEKFDAEVQLRKAVDHNKKREVSLVALKSAHPSSARMRERKLWEGISMRCRPKSCKS